MDNDNENKTPSPAMTSVDTDASARRTIVLDGPGDSTPAPAQFRMKPLATGTRGYSWAARVDKLTERLDKLQLRVELLEDSFEDPDDPTKDELDKLAPLQRARESLLVELRAAKEQLSCRSLEQGGFSEARRSRSSSLRQHGGESFCGTQVPPVPLRRGSSPLHP